MSVSDWVFNKVTFPFSFLYYHDLRADSILKHDFLERHKYNNSQKNKSHK